MHKSVGNLSLGIGCLTLGLCVAAIPLLIVVPISRAADWLTFGEQSKGLPAIEVNLDKQNLETMVLTSRCNAVAIEEERTDAGIFQRLSIPGEAHTLEVGKPMIPVISRLIAIPECKDIELHAEVYAKQTFSDYLLYPVQDLDAPEEGFSMREDAYSTNEEFPGKIVEIGRILRIRDLKVIQILIYPVQYNPANKELIVYPDIEVQLKFTGATDVAGRGTGPFDSICKRAVLGYEDIAEANHFRTLSGGSWVKCGGPTQQRLESAAVTMAQTI